MIERIDRTGWLDKSHSFDYTTNRRGADCKGQLSIPHVKRLTARVGELLGGQSFLLSSFFIWENFAMTSKVKWITSTIKLSNARMNVRSARVSNRVIRYPSLRLQGSRQGTFKKVSSRNLCLFYVEIENQRYGIESMTTNFAISTLLLF